jgi:hypothetical protein
MTAASLRKRFLGGRSFSTNINAGVFVRGFNP